MDDSLEANNSQDDCCGLKNDEEDSQESILQPDYEKSDMDVKSSAVVKYDVIKTPTTFSKLQSNTNLNLPPPNWLRRGSCFDDRWFEGLRGHWAFPGRSSNSYFSR